MRAGFQDTRVLEAQPDFIKDVVKVPFQLILTHCCVMLGPSGAGKTTLWSALGGDKFEANVQPGPHLRNRTKNAQAGELPVLAEDLQLVLIDTQGWSPETSTDIKSQYKQILKEKQLVSEHTPHIIMFCVPVSSIRQFQSDEAKKMSKQLQELKFDRRFPITVLPVATKADTEDPSQLPELLSTIKQLAQTAFQGSGAEVEEPLSTQFWPGGQPHGAEELKERLEQVLDSQLCSPEFRGLWQKALAESVMTKTEEHSEKFPENDSAQRLFRRACCTVAASCGKDSSGLDDICSTRAEDLPWPMIEDIPTAKGQNWRFRLIWCRPRILQMILIVMLIVICFLGLAWIRTERLEKAETVKKVHDISQDLGEIIEKETTFRQQAEKERDDLKKRADDMTKERGDLKKKADDMTKERNDLKKKAGDMTKERDDLKKKADDMTKERDDLKKKADDMTKERDDLKKKADDMTKERDDLKKKAWLWLI